MPSLTSAGVARVRPIITLITDFGLDDWYVATMKAVLLRLCPDARLIDVTHRVPCGDVLCGSITLERAVDGFLPETVHLAVVDPGVGTPRRMLIVRIREQWVVCPDNGLITWCWKRHGGGRAYELTWRPARSSATFHGRDIMGPAAAMLASGVGVEELGRSIDDLVLLDVAPAKAGSDQATIIHIDHFGNATTDYGAELLETGGGNPEVCVGGRSIGRLKRTYSDVSPGEAVALVGSSGLLEIAVRDGSAAQTLKLRVGQAVQLRRPERITEALRQMDKAYVWHPFTPMSVWLRSEPVVIESAEGMHLIDTDGNRYLDGVSSLWCNVHGHRVPEIDEAIRRQLEKVSHTTMLGLASEPATRLAEQLIRIAPKGLAKVFYSDAGATATEIAFKMAVQYWFNVGRPERTEFVALSEAYHGDTVGAMSVGRTMAFHRPYLPLMFPVHYAPTPYVYRSETPEDPEAVKRRCLEALERLLEAHHRTVAAVALEPVVQGAAGMIVQPAGFLAEVRRLATKYGVLLIADEVAVGFGRTGRMFACEHEGVSPDLMCVGKGISGGYLPLAATFATQAVFDAFLGEPAEGKTFFHGHTYTGNPLACAAALASLELMERRRVVEGVAEKAKTLAAMLAPVSALPHVGEIRQKGFMVGIELVEDRGSRRGFDPSLRIGAAVCERVRRHGVILRPLGDVVVMMPPLAMEEEDLRRIVRAVEVEVGAIG